MTVVLFTMCTAMAYIRTSGYYSKIMQFTISETQIRKQTKKDIRKRPSTLWWNNGNKYAGNCTGDNMEGG